MCGTYSSSSTRLKQICNADPKTGESSKLDDIKDRLGQLAAQGHKALLFSQYVSDTSGVAAAANYLGDFTPLTITGDMPQQERTEVIERFKARDEHKVLILSLRAGGLGLNLQEASYVFHLDRWWNPAVERQAEDRSHRIGQTVKVNVIKYSCSETIEERIDDILERKQHLFDELIDDVSPGFVRPNEPRRTLRPVRPGAGRRIWQRTGIGSGLLTHFKRGSIHDAGRNSML